MDVWPKVCMNQLFTSLITRKRFGVVRYSLIRYGQHGVMGSLEHPTGVPVIFIHGHLGRCGRESPLETCTPVLLFPKNRFFIQNESAEMTHTVHCTCMQRETSSIFRFACHAPAQGASQERLSPTRLLQPRHERGTEWPKWLQSLGSGAQHSPVDQRAHSFSVFCNCFESVQPGLYINL